MNILEVNQLTKTYTNSSGGQLTVLSQVSFQVEQSSTVAIVGTSGSGKTTLLGLCAGLDRPTSGSVTLCGIQLSTLSEDQRASVRNQHVGFVFQNFQLLPTLTALENVMVPLELQRASQIKSTAMKLLERVGLAGRANHYPAQLSGGEQQRVSIARAFANKPQILFADEPTGNLDDENSQRIEELIFALNREAGTTLVLVTHDMELASRTQRIIRLRGGMLTDS